MFKLEEIETITKGKIINGDKNKLIERYYISKINHYKDRFYIPIYWRGDRQEYIIDAVKSGVMGYMISKSYVKYDETVKESININPNICIISVENINDDIHYLGMYVREENIKYYDNQESLINELLDDINEGDLIYLKASKKMNFYNIVKKLEEI